MTSFVEVARLARAGGVAAQASRRGVAGLSSRQQLSAAVLLMAVVFNVLPSHAWIAEDAGLAAALVAVLDLLSRPKASCSCWEAFHVS